MEYFFSYCPFRNLYILALNLLRLILHLCINIILNLFSSLFGYLFHVSFQIIFCFFGYRLLRYVIPNALYEKGKKGEKLCSCCLFAETGLCDWWVMSLWIWLSPNMSGSPTDHKLWWEGLPVEVNFPFFQKISFCPHKVFSWLSENHPHCQAQFP